MTDRKIGSIAINAFTGTNLIEYLDLSYNRLSYLREDVFVMLNNLKTLKLNHNRLREIVPSWPHWLDSHLKGLQYLYMENNCFGYLGPYFLDRLHNLKLLDLKRNQLYAFGLNRLNNLNYLDLSFNLLSQLNEIVFYGSKNIRYLNLISNNLTTLPDILFHELINLKVLRLTKNNLRNLSEDLFRNLSNLKRLELDLNELVDLPEKLFNNLTELTELNLSENKLNNLSENIFKDLKSLSNLNFAFNRIEYLPEKIFSGLTELKFLILNGNNFTNLSKSIFDNLKKIDKNHVLKQLDSLTRDTNSQRQKINYAKSKEKSPLKKWINFFVAEFNSNNQIGKFEAFSRGPKFIHSQKIGFLKS